MENMSHLITKFIFSIHARKNSQESQNKTEKVLHCFPVILLLVNAYPDHDSVEGGGGVALSIKFIFLF